MGRRGRDAPDQCHDSGLPDGSPWEDLPSVADGIARQRPRAVLPGAFQGASCPRISAGAGGSWPGGGGGAVRTGRWMGRRGTKPGNPWDRPGPPRSRQESPWSSVLPAARAPTPAVRPRAKGADGAGMGWDGTKPGIAWDAPVPAPSRRGVPPFPVIHPLKPAKPAARGRGKGPLGPGVGLHGTEHGTGWDTSGPIWALRGFWLGLRRDSRQNLPQSRRITAP